MSEARCHYAGSAFVPGCYGAAIGGPEHCCCDTLEAEVERLQVELGRARKRAAHAEALVDGYRADAWRWRRSRRERTATLKADEVFDRLRERVAGKLDGVPAGRPEPSADG